MCVVCVVERRVVSDLVCCALMLVCVVCMGVLVFVVRGIWCSLLFCVLC